jgi:hypothetical protein
MEGAREWLEISLCVIKERRASDPQLHCSFQRFALCCGGAIVGANIMMREPLVCWGAPCRRSVFGSSCRESYGLRCVLPRLL